MIKNSLILILLLVIICDVYSQQITITGKIVDTENNKEVLAYSNIRIKNTTRGCVSNSDGVFQLKVDSKYKDSTLVVSYIGYEQFEEKISLLHKRKNVIKLTKHFNELNEVGVKAPDPYDIIAKAVLNFKKNNWQKPVNAEAFYREVIFQDGKARRMSEAACEYYIPPYADYYYARDFFQPFYSSANFGELDDDFFVGDLYVHSPKLKAKVIESRSSYDKTNLGINFCLAGGPLAPIGYDYFCNPRRNFDSYSKLYSYYQNKWGNNIKVDYSNWEGKPIFIIRGKSHEIFIDRSSYAIIQYKHSIRSPYSFKIKDMKQKSMRDYKNKKDVFCYDSTLINIKFFQHQDKWYYSSINVKDYSTYSHHKGEVSRLLSTRDIMFNSYETDSVKEISPNEAFKATYNSSLHYYATDYNPDFWENYNTLYPTELEQEIRKNLDDVVTLDEQYSKKFEYDSTIKPPVAHKKPEEISIGKYSYTDNYQWLNTANIDSVEAYVKQENRYTDNYFIQHSTFIREIANELSDWYQIKKFSLDKESDYTNGSYSYYFNDSIGRHGAICRKNGKLVQEIILDLNPLTKENQDYSIGWCGVNPNNTTFCYTEYLSEDIKDYNLVFLDINTKEVLKRIRALTCNWITDSTFIHLTRNEDDFYNRQIYYRDIKNNGDTLLFETSKDKAVFYNQTQSGKYIIIDESNLVSTECIYFIDKSDKKPNFKLLLKAKRGKDYKVHHFNENNFFYISTNEGAEHYNTFKVPINNTGRDSWELVLPESNEKEIKLLGKVGSLLIFSQLEDITQSLVLYNEETKTWSRNIEFEEELYTTELLKIKDSNNLRISYKSYIEPRQYYNYNIALNELSLIGADSLNNYNKKDYTAKLHKTTARDGTEIPYVLIYNKKKKKKIGKSPILLETYGGGNLCYNPNFNSEYLPLINRGFVVCFPLVRGSAELGCSWREKALNKKVALSGDDFIDVAKHLIDIGDTEPNQLFAIGTSHGGFVMSYVANNNPELFNSIVVQYPAGDLLTELADSTKADNVLDYMTFGSPYVKKELKELKRICPYQNIKQQNYPNMLFFAGWLDQNVNPIVSVKQTAKLRANKTDNNQLMLKVIMGSGHGTSGNKAYTEMSWIYTFILKNLE